MGLDRNSIKLLIQAKRMGVNYESTLTIGRQGLHINQKELNGILVRSRIFQKGDEIDHSQFAESFLKLLGAKKVDSLDASEYESATIIHDMNKPLDQKIHTQYSVVMDGGSLEHIFNFPVAIKNCMQLVKPGGHFIGITPANNFVGHGFYQFSPELFFRVFDDSNGFALQKMFLYVDRKRTPIFEVVDPKYVKKRVTLENAYRTYLFIIAKKTHELELMDFVPQQSDYEHIVWKSKNNNSISPRSGMSNSKLWYKGISIIKKGIDHYIKLLRRFQSRGISDSSLIKKTD